MGFLHWDMDAGPDNLIQVEFDRQANVLLMDDVNFNSYRNGRSYRYFGGLATRSPVRLVPPHAARWHVVVNLGGHSGNIRASCSMM
jgi:hypothetical protein